VHAVPAPFRSFALRSDEPQHAWHARAPLGSVHLVRAPFLDGASLDRLAAAGHTRCSIKAFWDIDYATTTLPELTAAVPHVFDLASHIASALQLTGLLGSRLADYRRSVVTRIDYLAARGAGFHNDVSRQVALRVLAARARSFRGRLRSSPCGRLPAAGRATCLCSILRWRTVFAGPAMRGRRWPSRLTLARGAGKSF
jgi:hypothetical protein